jgi:Ser-tRNA(Ala) deacylase AlaX
MSTRVAGVVGNVVTLEATIFYAFSGGQESDTGTIGGRRVVEARKSGSDILYLLDEDHGLAVGDAVDVAIDWPRRYRLMRLHFAAEVVLELVLRMRPGVEKIGAHIGEDRARIDFAWTGSIAQYLPGLIQDVARIVALDEAIASDYSDVATQRRFWRIAEFAQVPCGGTHLRRTGEVGAVALRRRNIGKDKERIEITLVEP